MTGVQTCALPIWFNGQLGVHNKNVAVKIEDRILEYKDDGDDEVMSAETEAEAV